MDSRADLPIALTLDEFLTAADALADWIIRSLYTKRQLLLIQQIRRRVIAALRKDAAQHSLVDSLQALPEAERARVDASLQSFTRASQAHSCGGHFHWSRSDTARAILRDWGVLCDTAIPHEHRAALRYLDLLLAGAIGEHEWLWTFAENEAPR